MQKLLFRISRPLHIQNKYFDFIKSGLKTVEGRLYTEEFHNLSKNTKIKFFTSDEQYLTCRLINFKKYPNFKEMLMNEGLEIMLPKINSLEKAIEIYQSFPNYKKFENEFGAIAMKLEVIDE